MQWLHVGIVTITGKATPPVLETREEVLVDASQVVPFLIPVKILGVLPDPDGLQSSRFLFFLLYHITTMSLIEPMLHLCFAKWFKSFN